MTSNGSNKKLTVEAIALPDEIVHEEDNAPPVSVFTLFRFATVFDLWLLFIAAILAAANGVVMPLFSIILGGLFDDFNFLAPGESNRDVAAEYAKKFSYLAIAAFFASFAQVGLFTIVSERIGIRIRKEYLNAVLAQDITWFDFRRSGELSAKVAENTVIIKESMGEKLGALFQFAAMFLGGFAVGFAYSWKLTLVICSLAPLLALGEGLMMKVMSDMTTKTLSAYSKAGAIADEALGNIRTVTAFGAQKRIEKNYERELKKAEGFGIRKGLNQGAGMGFTMLVMFSCYALAFAYGAILNENARKDAFKKYPNPDIPGCNSFDDPNFPLNHVFDNFADLCAFDFYQVCNCGCRNSGADCIEGGDIVLVFFSVLMGSFALGQAAPSVSALKNGQVSAGKIFAIIGRKPDIGQKTVYDFEANGKTSQNTKLDPNPKDTKQGLKPEKFSGEIILKNLTFSYPTRKEVKALDNVELVFEKSKTTALVGGSGSGKSTIVGIVQRFYDPDSGSVQIDGNNLKDIDLTYWRDQIGLVGQEPTLFATTIAKNIGYGAASGRTASMDEIISAAKAANAYDFIMSFPDKFETLVGERGAQLSGGQRQRIAIARAIVRDPVILLLDEATSALDNESEKVVQKALDDLLQQKSRTTLVIAHRLSTVRNADKIVVLGSGKVLEQGTHDELLSFENGAYSMLVAAANKSQEKYLTNEDNAAIEDNDDINVLIERASKNDSNSGSKQENSLAFQMLRESSLKKSSAKKQSSLHEVNKNVPKNDEKKEELYSVPISRVFRFAKGSYFWFIPGIISAILNGAQMPVFALLFAEISTAFYEPDTQDMRDGANFFAYLFVTLGAVAFLSNLGQFFAFGLIGEKITSRVRGSLFHALITEEIAFFDAPEHSIGALTSGLATDAALVKASVCDRLGLVVMNLVTVIAGLGIAFWKGWKLTLVLLAVLPCMAVAGAAQMLVLTGMAREDDKYMGPASQVLQESIAGIRTVTAFNSRERIVKLYSECLEVPKALGTRKGVVGGLGFAVSNSLLFFSYALAFYYGGVLIDRGEYDFQQMLTVFFAVVMTAMGLGQSVALAPDAAKGTVAVSNVFKIVDRQSRIDPTSQEGLKDVPVKGEIELKKVGFRYPSRPDADVFKALDLKIQGGKTIALVGSSGSGKSTVVGLIQRFYDPNSGAISLDSISDIKQANVTWLRSQLGLVEQEPRLFATTIKENIAYGSTDEVTDEEIIQAAKSANAHDFIIGFPKGYNTVVGDQGAQLSGGQRQRICIARAIIRKPKILLLDEATSALDNQSERIVQDALDTLVSNGSMTTIVVAHRLTTIRNADRIVVMAHGEVIETGKHEELLALKGAYSKLWFSQLKQEE